MWGQVAKTAPILQGGVESQRWGHFAKVGSKRKGGVESQRKGGVKTQMTLFNKDKLMKVANSRGYYNERAVCDGLAPVFDMTPKKLKFRINSDRLTKEECEVIGSFFEMTMKEYYDVFMNGLFKVDGAGNYVCHIDNMKEHMHPPEPEEPKKKPKTKRQKREDIIAEIEKI